jgi:uncharacterized protein YkwD
MPGRHTAFILALLAVLGLAVPSAGLAKAPRRHHHHHAKHVAAKPAKPVAKPAAKPATATPPAPSVPAVCPNAQTPALGAPLATMRAALLCLVNQQRVDRGLPALTESSPLDTSAQSWSNEMVTTGIFTHGTQLVQRIDAVGYDFWYAGENIATGFETPVSVLVAWMGSEDHCTNILDPNYANIGIGVNPNPVGSDVADAATWTQDFGLLMSAVSPPSANTGPMNGCPYSY